MNDSSPWVYLFSRFTSEALLFEALIIFTVSALYCAFWLLRKRKFGVIKREVPAGVVKYYLNELIGDAELLRAQLFGLLYGQGAVPTPLAGVTFGTAEAHATTGVSAQATGQASIGATAATLAGTPAALGAGGVVGDPQTLAALEAKLAAQAKQIEAFVAEKARVEKELTLARAEKNQSPDTSGNSGDNAKLQDKIAQLEGKLAEYSVIEDDLANLKRLQQENASLKAQLGGKGAAPAVSATAAAEAPSASIAAAEAQAPASTPAQAAATPSTAQAATDKPAGATATGAVNLSKGPGVGAPPTDATQLGAAVAEAEASGVGESGFEGLVDQVEKSLQKPEAAPDAAAGGGTQLSGPSTTPNPTATIEKSDADLVAEFEKMLNG